VGLPCAYHPAPITAASSYPQAAFQLLDALVDSRDRHRVPRAHLVVQPPVRQQQAAQPEFGERARERAGKTWLITLQDLRSKHNFAVTSG
jgi:hypothetical protein